MASVKFFLAILGVVVIAISIFADYKWRQWMEARRSEHQAERDRHPY